MTKQQLKEKILSELKTKMFPEDKSAGGQSIGKISRGITLYHPEMSTEISIAEYNSQIKNLEQAKKLFEVFLDEFLNQYY